MHWCLPPLPLVAAFFKAFQVPPFEALFCAPLPLPPYASCELHRGLGRRLFLYLSPFDQGSRTRWCGRFFTNFPRPRFLFSRDYASKKPCSGFIFLPLICQISTRSHYGPRPLLGRWSYVRFALPSFPRLCVDVLSSEIDLRVLPV